MIIAKDKAKMKQARAEILGKKVVFVPTMGALHEGHFTLVREARKVAGLDGVVVVSIFLNPTQFDNPEDLEKYPSTLEQDLKGCETEGVDIVFTPQADTMYAADASIRVSETMLSKTLCGAARSGHFNGVCTVVLKLYNLVQPDIMIFGEKDFQQVAVIQRMIRDLDIPVEIMPVGTVREESGLAMSSRNTRLSEKARKEAPEIYKNLKKLSEKLSSKKIAPSAATEFMKKVLTSLETETKIDYVEVVDSETMQPLSSLENREAILAIAVFFGDIRLIDHISVSQ